MPETGDRNDPFPGFNFLVEIGQITLGFSEASGLTGESDIIEYREGGEENTVRKLPGLKKFNNIALKRGYTASTDLWDWRKLVMDGQTERRSGTITLLNEERDPVLRWNFRDGWPVKLEGPSLNGKTSDVAIESLEIAHEGLVMETA